MRIAPAVLALALAAAACGGSAESATGCAPTGLTSIGEALPDCSFDTLGGDTLRLTDLRGTPHVLNFWASWCVSCIKEMPDFERLHKAAGNKLTIVGMDVEGVLGETRDAARAFVKRTGVTYPVAFDSDGLLYAHFSPRPLLPTTVFVGADGRVVEKHIGELSLEELRARVARTLRVSV